MFDYRGLGFIFVKEVPYVPLSANLGFGIFDHDHDYVHLLVGDKTLIYDHNATLSV